MTLISGTRARAVAILLLGWIAFVGRDVRAQNLSEPKFFPSAGAKDVCPDTTLRITFAGPMTLGSSGKIQIFDAASGAAVDTIDMGASRPPIDPAISRMPDSFAAPTRKKTIGGLNNYNYYPILITGNKAEIFPAPGSLAVGKNYFVTVDAGVFKCETGAYKGIDKAAEWKFSTKAHIPDGSAAKLIVAADGSGDFATIQGALDAIPATKKSTTTVFVRKGVYTELVYISDKHATTILGEDRKGTILQYATNDKFNGSAGGGGYRRGVFRANRCDDLILTNLTIRNTTPQGGTQAEAIIFNGSPTAHAIVSNVDLYSFQDTLQINGQAYIKDSYIEGDVDFMWGTGPCFFENCTCHSLRSRAYYTQIRNTAANHGYVYYHCTFDGAPNVMDNYLARIDPTRFPNSEVVLIDCVLTDAVGNVGWRLDGNLTDPPNVHDWEYNSHSADGQPVDVNQRLSISRRLTQPKDASLIASYSDPAFVLGHDWNAREVLIPKAP